MNSKFFVEDDDPEEDPARADLDFSGIIQKIKSHLKLYYIPVNNPAEAEFHFTTIEVYLQMQKLLPSSRYGVEEVALWLHETGFTFYDYGNLRFEWMMKKA